MREGEIENGATRRVVPGGGVGGLQQREDSGPTAGPVCSERRSNPK